MAVRNLQALLDSGVRGKRVFVRADLNVPLSSGEVSDDTRIRAALPTLRALSEAGARVILASHLGRPKGQPVPELSLKPVASRLSELLDCRVSFSETCVGESAQAAVNAMGDGDVLVLENLRFHKGETSNDDAFSQALANLADVYVNDAFGTSHRAHASTVGLTQYLSESFAGDLLRIELEKLDVVRNPKRPLLCLLGGAKVSDKLAVLEALAPHADALAVGGAMAYTFLAARGEPTGTSLVEIDRIADARRVIEGAKSKGRKLLLPVDHRVARKLSSNTESRVVKEIPDGWMGVDIGPESAASYAREAQQSATIFWNGPMGVFEIDEFADGTKTVARAVAESGADSIVGGGDSLAAINRLGLGDRIGHLSTGGGASLEYVQGLTLPGVAALEL